MNNGTHLNHATTFAKGLGWFSLGLGLAELLAPKKLARLFGIKADPQLLRALGAREIVNGAAILMRPGQPGWMMARVAGDVMDLALLGTAYGGKRNHRKGVLAAASAVAGVTVLDLLCTAQLRRKAKNGGTLHVTRVITVNRPREKAYELWRDFSRFPEFMNHLERVETTGGNRSHWVARGPAGSQVQWDAEITQDVANEIIAWRSLPGADVANAGRVRFERATGDRGTVVRVDLQYEPPGGLFGASLAKLLGEAPEKQLTVDLLRFKQLLETGEIARTEGQAAGRSRSTSRLYDEMLRQ